MAFLKAKIPEVGIWGVEIAPKKIPQRGIFPRSGNRKVKIPTKNAPPLSENRH